MQDCTSVSDFYSLNDPELCKVIGHICYDRSEHKDLRQEVYCHFLLNPVLPQYDASSSAFGSYIYGCVANVCNNHLIVKQRKEVKGLPDKRSYDPQPAYDLSERIGRFRKYLSGGDSTRALDFFNAKLAGRMTLPLGQQARNEYSTLLKRFLLLEHLSEEGFA